MVDGAPDLTIEGSAEGQDWVGRAAALVARTNAIDKLAFLSAAQRYGHSPWLFGNELLPILRRITSELELDIPNGVIQGFIPTGNAFDALVVIGKIFGEAKRDILIVDPYLDETILSDFAITLAEHVTLRLLADAATVKPSLAPACRRWATQYGGIRPIDARLSAGKTLHDRLIVVDLSRVWTVTQSFKDLAMRSPASIIPIASDVAALKLVAYESVWNAAQSI